jgi:hypothetical protein
VNIALVARDPSNIEMSGIICKRLHTSCCANKFHGILLSACLVFVTYSRRQAINDEVSLFYCGHAATTLSVAGWICLDSWALVPLSLII